MTYTKERAKEVCSGIQQCPNCKGWHDKHSPPLCFACATGMTNPKGHHPEL